MASAMAAGTATMPTIPGWASRSARAATTARPRCSGTPWPPSCGGGPPSPSSVPWAGWSASRRGSCAGWSGCRTPRWPSSSGAGRSTSTLSFAWTRPPPAAALVAWPHQRSHSRPPSSRTPCGSRSRPSGCPARPSMGGRSGMPAGASSSTSTTSPRPMVRPGSCRPSRSPGYIAKYATKATESFGSGLDRRLTDDDDLERLDKLPAHVAELVRAAWELGGRPELEGLRLRPWAHMLGFRGHWSTKSRRYSTTFTVLRRARVAFAKRRRARDGVPLDAWDRPEDDQAVIVVASWVFVGAGYETEGERWLALSAAARAREQRRIAREELTTTTASAAA